MVDHFLSPNNCGSGEGGGGAPTKWQHMCLKLVMVDHVRSPSNCGSDGGATPTK